MKRLLTLLVIPVVALLACDDPTSTLQSPDVRAGMGPGGAGSSCDVTVPTDVGTVQEAVDDAGTAAGDVVCVEPGTYAENVTVDKEITLRGTTPPSGSDPAVVDGQLSVTAAGVTVESLRVAPTTVFTVGSGLDPYGIRVTASGVLVEGNVVSGLTGDASGGSGSGTVHGIQVWNGSEPFVRDVGIRGNTIVDLANEGDASAGWPHYGGAAGIKVQGVVRDVEVTGNTVRGVHSAGWVYGVTLTHTGNDPQARSPENVIVERNTLAELNDGSVHDVFDDPASAPYPGVAFAVDDTENPSGPGGADADQATVALNNFLNVPIGTSNKDRVHTLVAECNYWGHASGPSNAANDADRGASAVGDVDYTPWSVRQIGRGANPEKSCVGGDDERGKGNGGGQGNGNGA